MLARRLHAAVASAVVLAALVACSDDSGGGAGQPSTTTASPTSSTDHDGAVAPRDVPAPETLEFAADWPAPGRDLRGSRAVPESAITTATVDDLVEAWSAPLPGPGVLGNASSTPLVLGDTVIVQDLSSTVRALDLATGEELWVAEYDLLSIGPNGPAAGYGRVFAAKGTREIAALDLATGDELWSTELPLTPSEGIDIQPQVYGGLVFASTVPISLAGQYVGGDRGILHALDVATGEIRWSFDTIEDGEALWGNPEVNSGGGAWFTPSVDAETGTIYWGIANPAPFPGTAEFPNGSSRPGPNLYTDSVVALDAATGELLWYEQAIEHDIFDRDLVHTLLVEAAGTDVLIGTGKMGRVIGHDPATGEVLFDTPVGRHQGDDLTELTGPTEILPGTYGGVLTPPAAADGVVYVALVNAPSLLSPDEPHYLGSQLGELPGEVAAVEAGDGRLLWSTEVPGDPLGGATVVGDLVFTATYQGQLLALDRATGELVWTYDAPGGVNGWPAVAGDTILWPIGSADPPVLLALRLP